MAVHDSIDTVERFQGGERDVIIVSATASDPDYVLAEADFLLNLNRLNVALSRPRKKLIVVASRSVINLLVSDLDSSAMPSSGSASIASMPQTSCGMATVTALRCGYAARKHSRARGEYRRCTRHRPNPTATWPCPPRDTATPVLVLHAWWGLNDTIKATCTRLAQAGFVAFAPDLYHGEVTDTIAGAERLAQALFASHQQAEADVAAAARFLDQRAGQAGRGLAVIGFSLGAYYALQLAAADPDHVRSVVLFYGTGGADVSRSRQPTWGTLPSMTSMSRQPASKAWRNRYGAPAAR